MSDENKKTVASAEDIAELLKENFVFTDNVPEDTNRRQEIIMEARASLLIDSYCTSPRFPTFMKAGRRIDSAWVFPLTNPITQESKMKDTDNRDIAIKWEFKEFIVRSENPPKPDDYGQTFRWGLFIHKDPRANITNIPPLNLPENKSFYKQDIVDIQSAFSSTYNSLWKLCKDISPYNTPEKVCRLFDNAPFPFIPLKPNSATYRGDIFHEQEDITTKEIVDLTKVRNLTEVSLFQSFLKEIILNPENDTPILLAYEKKYSGWFRMVYTFKNEHGEPIMKVAKLYDTDMKSQTKSLIPMTMWMRNKSISDQLYCVPLSVETQPLYNLDKLQNDEGSPVILTDSIEIADANNLNNVIFTSFICDPKQYDQVDWSPLKNRTFYYLVTNHSGSLLESAYLKAKEFAKYWEERIEKNKEDDQESNLKFIQLKVDYPEKMFFESVDDILNHYAESKPVVNQESVEVFEDDRAFEAQYQKALKFFNEKPLEWWEKQSKNSEEQRLIKDEFKKPKNIDYVVHPILICGEATMIYAKKSTGKSMLALSLAANAATSLRPKRIFNEKWWGVSGHQPDMYKVLYLDFENGETTINQRYKSVIYPQWPNDKNERKKCEENLIIKDMTQQEYLDYSAPENHNKIMDMIDEAEASGSGKAVDLLVIDTYSKFVNDENPQTSDNFSKILNKIRKKNIAILIVHHSNKEGLPRGYKKMLDDLYLNIRLYRDNDDVLADLSEPLKLRYISSRSSINVAMGQEFEITFNGKMWKVYNPLKDENEEVRIICDAYKKCKYQRDQVCEMLGIHKSALSDYKTNQ